VPDGNGWTPKRFSTFCPKAIAGLRTLPVTLASRCIPIRLQPRLASEYIEPWFSSEPPQDAAGLRDRCAAWAAEHIDELGGLRRTVARPLDVGDRAFDVWRPVLAIGEIEGIAEIATVAATELNGRRVERARSDGLHALDALARLLADRANVATADIAFVLNANDELDFADRRRGDGIIGRDVAKLLKPFGLRTKSVRLDARTLKGYRAVDCAEGIARWLPGREAPRGSGTSGTSGTSKPQSQANVPDVPDVPDGRGAPTELPARGELERLRTGPTLDECLRALPDDPRGVSRPICRRRPRTGGLARARRPIISASRSTLYTA
jgi:hypothetical protein